jgi:hypothetical protein
MLTILMVPQSARAIAFVQQPDVFTPDRLERPLADQTYYGSLNDFPHTFYFFVPEETTVSYTLATRPDASPVSLLLVREAQRGVTEVVRQTGQSVTWELTRDRRVGIALMRAPTLTATLVPGAYRLEVSNPVNQGKYQLTVGMGSQGGFWAALRDSFRVHHFYGHWTTALFTLRMLLLVGLVVGLGVAFRWYVRRI